MRGQRNLGVYCVSTHWANRTWCLALWACVHITGSVFAKDTNHLTLPSFVSPSSVTWSNLILSSRMTLPEMRLEILILRAPHSRRQSDSVPQNRGWSPQPSGETVCRNPANEMDVTQALLSTQRYKLNRKSKFWRWAAREAGFSERFCRNALVLLSFL